MKIIFDVMEKTKDYKFPKSDHDPWRFYFRKCITNPVKVVQRLKNRVQDSKNFRLKDAAERLHQFKVPRGVWGREGATL